MTTLFISDLHLEDGRPQVTRLLLDFLASELCTGAKALYILGDLFEFWIGDDLVTETAGQVGSALRSLSEGGVECHFMHGNRDFLLGAQYAEYYGMVLLPEEVVVDLQGTPYLLLHGDSLCTDDHAYQAFRRQVRDAQFQRQFLAKSLDERLQIAQSARDQSMAHKGSTADDIMDVNQAAVNKAFTDHDVRNMIHGHTHRPAVHTHRLDDGQEGTRFVLADWNENGSCLAVSDTGYAVIPVTGQPALPSQQR